MRMRPRYMTIAARRVDHYVAVKWLLLLALVGATTYELMQIYKARKFVTLELNHERFTDQLFGVCAGLTLANALGRKFHPSEMTRNPPAEHNLKLIAMWFPRLTSTMRKISGITEEICVPYAPLTRERLDETKDQAIPLKSTARRRTPWSTFYHEGVISRFLESKTLIFSSAASLDKDHNIDRPRDRHFAMCVHIGQRIPYQHTTDYSIHDVAKAARSVASRMNLESFYIFADRSEFAEALEGTLRINVKWQPNVHISTFTQEMNMYTAANVCGAVLLTEGDSTHSFWIGFFATKQDAVFYMKPKKDSNKRQLFLPTWQAYTDEI